MSEGEDGAATRRGSLCHFDEDSGCASGDDSDDSGKGALLDDETAASAALQARLPVPPLDWGCSLSIVINRDVLRATAVQLMKFEIVGCWCVRR